MLRLHETLGISRRTKRYHLNLGLYDRRQKLEKKNGHGRRRAILISLNFTRTLLKQKKDQIVENEEHE
jgi:hypothetical protein